MEYNTKSAEETKEVGKKFATYLRRTGATKAAVALVGELGSGKTTYTQGLANALGIDKRIISPTYILMRHYKIDSESNKDRLKNFYHVDLYRLSSDLDKEVKNLGLNELWEEEGNIIVIEWAEKIKNYLPKEVYWVEFEVISEKGRAIRVVR